MPTRVHLHLSKCAILLELFYQSEKYYMLLIVLL